MDKLQVYRIATFGLLTLNLILLAAIFLLPALGQGTRMRAIDRFDMDDAQHESFLVVANDHHRLITDINTNQYALLKEYFGRLYEDHEALSDSIPSSILALEEEKIRRTYQHFRTVKSLLTSKQREEFPAFVESILEKILLDEKEKRHPPKE